MILTRWQSVNFIDFIGFIDRYWIDKNYPVSVEGAIDCNSSNVDFKGGNEIICWQALHKRLKRLHYDFFLILLFNYSGFITNINYFSFPGFSASSLSLSQAIAFNVTFRSQARGRPDDLFHFKNGWKSNEDVIVLHQHTCINKTVE